MSYFLDHSIKETPSSNSRNINPSFDFVTSDLEQARIMRTLNNYNQLQAQLQNEQIDNEILNLIISQLQNEVRSKPCTKYFLDSLKVHSVEG
jgi:hypothetical protein